MSFDPTIPADLPPPSQIVSQIRTNFSQYANVFDNNHITINLTDEGQHSNVILQEQLVDPTISGNYDSLYSKSVTSNSSTSQELFVKIPAFLPNPTLQLPMQLTFNTVNTAGPNQYQSFVAGGYIVYFGNVTAVPITITLSPAPSDILCIIANGNDFTTVGTPIPFDAAVLKINNFQFTITSAAAAGIFSITWFAIGKQ